MAAVRAAIVGTGHIARVFLAKADTHWYRDDRYYTLWWRGNWSNECGGVLLNHAWHLLDQCLWIVGKPVRAVVARMGAFVHTPLREKAVQGVPIEDTVVALLEFADGTIGEVTGAVTTHILRAQIEIFGERGAVCLNPWILDSRDPACAAELEAWVAGAVEPLPADWQPAAAERDRRDGVRQYRDPTWSHTPQVRDVLDSIAERRAPAVDGRQARTTLEVILAAYRSALLGEAVRLPLAPDDPFYDGVEAALRRGVVPR